VLAPRTGTGRPPLRLGTDPADFTELDVGGAAQQLRAYFAVTPGGLQTTRRGAPGVRAVEIDFDWTAPAPYGRAAVAVVVALQLLRAAHGADYLRCAFTAPTAGIQCDLLAGDAATLRAAVQTLPVLPGHYVYAGDTGEWRPVPTTAD